LLRDLTVIEIYWLKGKSFWVFYALRRCLAEKKPVIWYHESTPFLFVEDGVYKAREHFGPTTHKTLVWTLVDSDESPSGVPSRLTVKGTQHFIIFNTSPQPMRWKHMEKSTNWAICVMNPWTRKEISKALAHPLPSSVFGLIIFFSIAL